MKHQKTEAKTPHIQPPISSSGFSSYALFDFSPNSSQLFSDAFRKHSITALDSQISPDSIKSVCSQCTTDLSQSVCGHSFCRPCNLSECPICPKIPWDASQHDIRSFFGNCRFPSLYAQSIHILMDRTTGKTLSDAFVEFSSLSDLWNAIETRQEKPLKGRLITITKCSQQELLSAVFPKWRGTFQDTIAIPPTIDIVKTMSTAAGGGPSSSCPPFITREEINSLLVICKNYKLHFSRKCAERPFENIITIIVKYPWNQSNLISSSQRDHVFDLLKLSLDALKMHLSKDYIQIDPTLLERLVLSGLMCPAFTEHQKSTLIHSSGLKSSQNLFFHSLNSFYSSYHPSDPSSLLLEIKKNCQQKPKRSVQKQFGIPLLIYPPQSNLSPWAPTYSPNLWKAPVSVEKLV